jgi:hypothetical protein
MRNARISLDGTWEFIHVASDRYPKPVEVRSIEVPGPWQAQFDDLRTRGGMGLYRRVIEVPAGWLQDGERIFLCFGAVFHITRVWLNDNPVGAHEGGFLPFAFDVTPWIRAGANEIKLRVESPSDDASEFPDTPLTEIPFGKQSWYGPLSGVWQSVYLERRNPEHIARLRITPELETGRVRTRVFLAQPPIEDAALFVTVFAPGGEVVAEREEKVLAGTEEAGLEVLVPGVAPWSPDTPNLYRLRAKLVRGAELDEVEDTFGFRTITTKNGRFLLNGDLLYIRGALDQDYYPDTIATVPSVEFLEDQARKAKALGLNCLRCHIKAVDPRYYEVADRIGLLVWTELPNGGLSTERSRARREATLKGIVDRDYNHPSIFCWTIINENWGVDLVHDPDHRAWLKQTYQWLKGYDPTRLVVDNSPLSPSFHVHTDIADYHFYAAFPDSRLEWDRFVDDLASRPAWLFSPEADAVQTGEEPLMCSEFGNWGLPDPAAIRNPNGREPWWFETGHDWGEGVMYPHGIEHRFVDWSLDRVFGDLESFVTAAQWQQFAALKYEIETMRRYPSLAGYVITQLTDVHWESNGLLDMRRNARVFHDAFRTINADTIIIPRWDRLAYWGGETATIDLYVANGGPRPLTGTSMTVRLAGENTFPVPTVADGGVAALGKVTLQIPIEGEPQMRTIEFELKDGGGRRIAGNSVSVGLHPPRLAKTARPLWSPDPQTCEYLQALGYTVADRMENALIVVATAADTATAAFVRAGGSLILMPEAEMSLNPFFPHWQNVKVVARQGTLWRGDWASTFAWLRRGKAFGHLPGGPMLDATFDRVMPTYVINGCNLLDFQGRVYAGIVIGWIHKAAALLVERPYGKGRFVCSTLRLFRDPPGADPTATMLLDGLIAVADGPLRHTQGLRESVAAAT